MSSNHEEIMQLDHVVKHRWSPRVFTSKPVSPELLRECFEAVRWSQSSWNEQPWRFLLTYKDGSEGRRALEACLSAGNAWAKDAWVLGVSFAKRTLTRNGKPNRVALHDVGAVNQALALIAFSRGLNTRFMAGFDVEAAREMAPDDFEPAAVFALGHADPAALKAGPGPRERLGVGRFVFGESWGQPCFPDLARAAIPPEE